MTVVLWKNNRRFSVSPSVNLSSLLSRMCVCPHGTRGKNISDFPSTQESQTDRCTDRRDKPRQLPGWNKTLRVTLRMSQKNTRSQFVTTYRSQNRLSHTKPVTKCHKTKTKPARGFRKPFPKKWVFRFSFSKKTKIRIDGFHNPRSPDTNPGLFWSIPSSHNPRLSSGKKVFFLQSCDM